MTMTNDLGKTLHHKRKKLRFYVEMLLKHLHIDDSYYLEFLMLQNLLCYVLHLQVPDDRFRDVMILVSDDSTMLLLLLYLCSSAKRLNFHSNDHSMIRLS